MIDSGQGHRTSHKLGHTHYKNVMLYIKPLMKIHDYNMVIREICMGKTH